MNDAYIHPNALVETATIGQGTRIWAFTHVMKNARIGRNCNIGDHCFLEEGVTIGDNVTIKNANMIWRGVNLEDGAFIGPGVCFTNDLYPRSPRLPESGTRYSRDEWLVPTLVRRGASLGAGAVIIAGVTIGQFAMVGAGAVVTKDVPPYALVVGNPATLFGWVCQCGRRLHFQDDHGECGECGGGYRKSNESSVEPVLTTVSASSNHPPKS